MAWIVSAVRRGVRKMRGLLMGPLCNMKNKQKSSDLISCQSGNLGLCVWQVWTMGLLDPKWKGCSSSSSWSTCWTYNGSSISSTRCWTNHRRTSTIWWCWIKHGRSTTWCTRSPPKRGGIRGRSSWPQQSYIPSAHLFAASRCVFGVQGYQLWNYQVLNVVGYKMGMFE